MTFLTFFFLSNAKGNIYIFLMSVDLVFFPMKVYPMLFGPQCSSTYLLLCLTEESKSYRFLNDMRVNDDRIFFLDETSLLHNFVLVCRIALVLLWSGMRLDHWQVEKEGLVTSTNAQRCEKSQARCFSDLWPWRCSFSMLGTHWY